MDYFNGRNDMKHILFGLLMFGAVALVRAEDAATTNAAAAPAVEAEKPAAKVIVLLPEQMDGIWYWSYYTTESQHIVQSAIEKALISEGLDVIDLATVKQFGSSGTINDLLQPAGAANKAREAGATFVITGSATAVHAGQSTAYGATVARSQAEIRVKIVRVSDGKVLAMEEASALEGGMATRMAGQEALKKAVKQIATKIAKATKTASEAK